MSLIKAHRTHGHLAARLDPLGSEPEGDPALDPEPLGLTADLMAKLILDKPLQIPLDPFRADRPSLASGPPSR